MLGQDLKDVRLGDPAGFVEGACMRVAFLSNSSSMSTSNVETNSPASPHGSSLLVRANEGRTLSAFGETFVILVDGKRTGTQFTAFLIPVRPAAGQVRITMNTKMNGSTS